MKRIIKFCLLGAFFAPTLTLAHGPSRVLLVEEIEINATPDTIHTSLVAFNVPIFMSLYSLEEFKKKAASMVELLVNGLAKRH